MSTGNRFLTLVMYYNRILAAMNTLLSAILVTVGFFSAASGWSLQAAGGAEAPAARLSPAQQELLAVDKTRREAVVRVDLPQLDAMSARDLIYVDAHGIERNKQEYLDHLRTEGVHYTSYALEDQTVRIEGKIGVITGLFRFNVTVTGKSSQGSQLYTAVFVREVGAWKLLIWHPTTKAA